MCTAISYNNNGHLFGRTLDLEISYNEKIIITPRNFPLKFRHESESENHFSIIGTGIIANNFPLYFDAMNEKGLSIAGLNFPESAYFESHKKDLINIATFEVIPYILGYCTNVSDAENLLNKINITNDDFNNEMKAATLHWIIADKEKAITLECTKSGMKIYENKMGVLTNEPEFSFHKTNAKLFLKDKNSKNLPGDLSSSSRFIRAAFANMNSVSNGENNISQFFHILDFVKQIKGLARFKNGKYEITQYSSCMDTENQIYYYNTYLNRQINAVSLNNAPLDSQSLISFNQNKGESIFFQN